MGYDNNFNDTGCNINRTVALPYIYKRGLYGILGWIMLCTITPFFLLLAFLFLVKFHLFGALLCAGIAFFPIWLLFLYKDAKLEQRMKKAVYAYNGRNLTLAIEYFHQAKRFIRKSSPRAFAQELWINDMIYNCYYSLENYEKAIDYLKEASVVSNKTFKLLECLSILKRHAEFINVIQKEFSQEDKDRHPSIYAMLAEAFLALGQNDAAREALLSGPVDKREMNGEMCLYRYALGEFYQQTGEKENALKEFQKIYAYDTNFREVGKKIESLTNSAS